MAASSAVKALHSPKMWLDRFSGQSTPSASPPPQNRSYSPTPRRPTHLAPEHRRPSFTPRSSSLNPGPRINQSSTSSSSYRLPNGSNLKRQFPPPANAIDPVSILEDIIGRAVQKEVPRHETKDSTAEWGKPDQFLEDVDFRGLSLQDFAEAADREVMNGQSTDQHISARTVHECEYVLPSGKILGFPLNHVLR